MSSGRQPALWEALPALTLPILLIAGQQDLKFVSLASTMAALLSQQMSFPPSATEVPIRQNPTTACPRPQNDPETPSQVHQPCTGDDEDTCQTQASHGRGDAAGQSFPKATSAIQPKLDPVGPCEQPMTGVPAETSVQIGNSIGCGCRVLQGSGHACHVERPELVAAALECFMSSLVECHCSTFCSPRH